VIDEMTWIWESVKLTYAFLAVIPLIPFLVLYFSYYLDSRDKKKAFRLAMDITMVLLVGSVAVLFNLIFKSSFGFYGILLLVLISAGLMGNLQYRAKGKLDVMRIVRAVWRLGFFFMSLMYVLLMCIRIGQIIWYI
jgi:hypothetical protein